MNLLFLDNEFKVDCENQIDFFKKLENNQDENIQTTDELKIIANIKNFDLFRFLYKENNKKNFKVKINRNI